MKQSADSLKKVSLELGGNAPFIVFDDANLDSAVAGAVASKFRNAGQTCVTANRFLIQSGIYDKFAAKFAEKVQQLKQGDGFADGVIVGPVINKAAVEKVDRQVKNALANGGKLLCGGKLAQPNSNNGIPKNNSGYFYEPTVITNCNPSMEAFEEETFGPAAFLYKFNTDEEAIGLANNTKAGLASYFYTESVQRQWKVFESLEYGMVGVNQPMVSSIVAPFGGIKESGFGREGSHYGLDDYLEYKAVHITVQ